MNKKAYTLIELLVVIAILAILSAILLPVFSQAKLAAKKSTSISNLRQISTAWTIYNSDHDDTCMRAYTAKGSGYVYWWGEWDGYRLDESKGALYPYLNSRRIRHDSTLNSAISRGLGENGYAYNYAYLSPSTFSPPNWDETPIPVSSTSISDPSNTVLFASSARLGGWQAPYILETNGLLDPPSYNYPTFHARYGADNGVVSWSDTHVTSVKPQYREVNFGWNNYDPELFRENNLGDITNGELNDELFDLL
jgi:prepilin-type N-terminal cleavage/methylation domain-containing protein